MACEGYARHLWRALICICLSQPTRSTLAAAGQTTAPPIRASNLSAPTVAGVCDRYPQWAGRYEVEAAAFHRGKTSSVIRRGDGLPAAQLCSPLPSTPAVCAKLLIPIGDTPTCCIGADFGRPGRLRRTFRSLVRQ